MKGKIRSNLKISITEGIFAAVMLGFTENFWVPCAEALKVTALRAGLVSTLPQFISSLSQTFSAHATQKLGGRIPVLKKLIAVQWVALFILIFLPFFPVYLRYSILMICATAFVIGGALPAPAWLSLMSDHLPLNSKGKYFGWRNRILWIVIFVSGLCAGQILQLFKKNILWGFSVLFGIASLSRFISWSLLIQMHDPKPKNNPTQSDIETADFPKSFPDFVLNGFSHNFVRFAFFVFSFTFAVNITAPYLAVYMLRQLHFSYSTFAYVIFSATLASIFGFKIWGELADKFGHLKVTRATTLFISIVPVFWFISGDPLWLIGVQIAAGFVWSGFQLCVTTFALSEIPSHIRTRAIGYLSALNGSSIFLGSLLGGVLLDHSPLIHGSAFHTLFLLSAFMRILSIVYFFKKLKETRTVKSASILSLYADALGILPAVQYGKEFIRFFSQRKKE